jgi:hypothetical protein
VQAQEGLGSLLKDGTQAGEGAKAAIGQKEVAGLQPLEKRARQGGFVLVLVAVDKVQERTAGQAKEADELEPGKTAAGLLLFGLGPELLVGWGIGHGNAGAIDDLDRVSLPEVVMGKVTLELLGEMGADVFEGAILQPGARLAIAPGLRAGSLRPAALEPGPSQHAQNGIAAGRTAFEHLREESPEGNQRRKDALTTIDATGVGSEPRLGDEVAESFLELVQGASGLVVLQEPLESGLFGFAEEERSESSEERSGMAHGKSVYIRSIVGQPNRMKNLPLSARQVATLRARFERCQHELSTLDWLSEGSVGENHPGSWRWTRKVKAKTVTVALSPAQAAAFRQAIDNHRRLEKLIKEMRALSQTFLLGSIAGPPHRTSVKNIPKRP